MSPKAKPGRHQAILTQLGRRIVRGEFDDPHILPSEITLGEDYGVSRTVLREVMRVLSEKGLVESRQKLGTRVLPRGYWDLLDEDVLTWHIENDHLKIIARDLVEARAAIEPEAAAHAAERRTEQELRWLTASFEEMTAEIRNPEAFVRADLRFHEGILEASKNMLFMRMAHAIRAALTTSRLITVRRPGSSLKSLGLHREVLNAIASQKPARARSVMANLVAFSAADINAVLKKEGRKK